MGESMHQFPCPKYPELPDGSCYLACDTIEQVDDCLRHAYASYFKLIKEKGLFKMFRRSYTLNVEILGQEEDVEFIYGKLVDLIDSFDKVSPFPCSVVFEEFSEVDHEVGCIGDNCKTTVEWEFTVSSGFSSEAYAAIEVLRCYMKKLQEMSENVSVTSTYEIN